MRQLEKLMRGFSWQLQIDAKLINLVMCSIINFSWKEAMVSLIQQPYCKNNQVAGFSTVIPPDIARFNYG